jgi:hypothetical protein
VFICFNSNADVSEAAFLQVEAEPASEAERNLGKRRERKEGRGGSVMGILETLGN